MSIGFYELIYVLIPVEVFEALREQTEDELAGLEAWADQEEDFVDFDPAG